MNYQLRIKEYGRRNKRKGFTLTEVVVASSLLIFAMVPILKALTHCHVGAKAAEQKTISLSVAKLKLDEIKAGSIYNYDSSFAQSNQHFQNNYYYTVSDSVESSDLRIITVDAGFDANNNNSLGADRHNHRIRVFTKCHWLRG